MEYCGGCREDEAKPLVGISAFISCFDAVDPVTGRQNLNTFIKRWKSYYESEAKDQRLEKSVPLFPENVFTELVEEEN